jgi:hypothetical protein
MTTTDHPIPISESDKAGPRSLWSRVAWRLEGLPGRLVRRWISASHFSKLRGIHSGKRGFVIGNGPSLRMEDLDRLTGEITIASNKIYLAFERTGWRPTFHTMLDPLVVQKIGSTIGQSVGTTYVGEREAHFVKGCRVYTFRGLGGTEFDPEERIQFSADVAQGTYSGYTVTFENLQLAYHLGLNPVYLVGCDHYYRGEKGAAAQQKVPHSGEQNHFIPNYREKGEIVYAAPIERMTLAYRHVRAFADRHGWRVLNATRGGYLEVFDRVSLDEVLGIR